MQVELRVGGLITVNGHEIALGQTFGLLDAIARDRSVRAAAERLEVSYRSAWGRVLSLEQAIGQPVVEKTKGHGSVLTPFGEELRRALEAPLN
ncbi:MAG TPA: LysR family transcriptional regulator, partial [Beijerinckiaceae bacterium]|nr:LysR family transcriptional regulator [Beijerinckiaceae bacterium]